MVELWSGDMETAVAKKKRFPWIIYLILLFLIVGVALAPVGCVVLAGTIGDINGCKVDEGSVHPCVIAGKDYGQSLYTLGVLGWFMLLTLPAGVVLGLFWLIILLVHRVRWNRRQRELSARTAGSI